MRFRSGRWRKTPYLLSSPGAADRCIAAGKRRYLTVMFCDLVGSTGISAQLDAEEWRDLVGGYLDAASAAVTEMGGHVAKKLGDGLLALFGYPVAQENDSERAARAALSIQRALAELNRKNAGSGKPELAARIGLETGPAVVDAAGEIYGDVANVAARVQALAEPGAVLVTARVQRQVAGVCLSEDCVTNNAEGLTFRTELFLTQCRISEVLHPGAKPPSLRSGRAFHFSARIPDPSYATPASRSARPGGS